MYRYRTNISYPYNLTIQVSLKNKDATIRNRDTTEQVRVKISDIKGILRALIDGEVEFNQLK